ncbi:MAG: hypothetical protein IJQ81_07310 [Oscillibacter sp.]|nr:hypothetical protein [Oscillibacter sp.]
MKKRLLALLLTVMVFASVFALPAMAVTKSEFNDGDYCTVRIDQKLLDKRGKQYAKVTLRTYDVLSWKTSGKVVVTMTDEDGNYIWSGVKTCGVTLKLGDDHPVYRIYVDVYYEDCADWDVITQGNNFTNAGKCASWKFLNEKDCSIS